MIEERRIVIVGTSSTGKTTLARKLSERLKIPHRELDSFYWQAGWTPLDREVFRERVREFISQPQWITDGNYQSLASDITWSRATHIIWLDYKLLLILKQFFSRSIRRSLKKEELWNGNKETLWNNIFRPDSLLVWILKTYGENKRRFTEVKASNQFPNINFIQLRSPQETRELLNRLADC